MVLLMRSRKKTVMSNKKGFLILCFLLMFFAKAEDNVADIIRNVVAYRDSCRFREQQYSKTCKYFDFGKMMESTTKTTKSFTFQLGFINEKLARIKMVDSQNKPISTYEIFNYNDSITIMIPFSYSTVRDTLKTNIEFGFFVNNNGQLTYWVPNNKQQVGDDFYVRGGSINSPNDVAAIVLLNSNLEPQKYLRFEFGKFIFMSSIEKISITKIIHKVFISNLVPQPPLNHTTSLSSCYVFFKEEYKFLQFVKSKSDKVLKYKIYFTETFLKEFNIE